MFWFGTGFGTGQELLKATAGGQKALQDLLTRCVESRAVKEIKDAKGTVVLEIADASKLRKTIATNRSLLTTDLRDALLIRWRSAPGSEHDMLAEVLGALAEQTKTERDQGLALWAAADTDRRERRFAQAVEKLEKARRLFVRLRDSAWEATCLHDLGVVNEAAGEPGKAVALLQKALDMRRRLYGEENAEVARTRTRLGVAYNALGDEKRALAEHQQALATRRKLLGDQHRDVAESLGYVGLAYDDLGESRKAIGSFEKALTIWRKLYGEKHADVAITLSNLGACYGALGEHRKALDYFEQSLKIRRQLYGDRHTDVADSLRSMGVAYVGLDDLDKALQCDEKALAIWHSLHGEIHTDVAMGLNSVGVVHHYRGEEAKALAAFQQALAIRRKLFGPTHPSMALSLHNVGFAFSILGDPGRAVPYYQQCLDVCRKNYGQTHPRIAHTLLSLGSVFMKLGEAGKALACFQESLSICQRLYPKGHNLLADSQHNVGMALGGLGEPARALASYQQGLLTRRKVFGERHRDVAQSLNSIGATYLDLNQPTKARECFEQALAIRIPLQGAAHLAVAMEHYNIGQAHQTLNLPKEALESFSRAVAICLVRKDKRAADPSAYRCMPQTLEFLTRRALALEQLRGTDASTSALLECDAAFALAIGFLDRLRRENLDSEQGKASAGQSLFDLFPRRISLCQRLTKLTGKDEYLRTAFMVAEQGLARAFLESLSKARAGILSGAPPELLAKEQRFQTQLHVLDGRIEKEQARPLEQREQDRIRRLYEERQRIEGGLHEHMARLEKEYPQYAVMKYPTPCSLPDARACLERNEVALLFILGSDASYVVLVEDSSIEGIGVSVRKLPGSTEIAEQVAALTDPGVLASATQVRELGAATYSTLLGPVADAIRGKNLLFVASGPLCLFPFELLVEPKGTSGGRFLVEGHRIRYAPSLTVLRLLRRWDAARRRPERMLFALGDPVYSETDERLDASKSMVSAAREQAAEYLSREGHRKGGFARLRFSGQEVRQIGKLLGSSEEELLTGTAATESAVKAASTSGHLSRYRYLHFATHGILGLDSGQQPALVLSLVGDKKEDGFLQLDEVANLKLNADLVVLSACRSGQGRLYNGEGVKGLARAFLYAGSRAVLCSLWQVEDRETAHLMVSFYNRLKAGQRPADALQATQLDMIHQRKAPLFWAPFVLIGE
jgi:CHAT domain-containing protein/Tfp pilus assembly protein PilF